MNEFTVRKRTPIEGPKKAQISEVNPFSSGDRCEVVFSCDDGTTEICKVFSLDINPESRFGGLCRSAGLELVPGETIALEELVGQSVEIVVAQRKDGDRYVGKVR